MFENLSDPLLVARNIKLYTGTGNPELARKVADILHLELQGLLLEKFANGEIYARFDESVRGDEVFFIQSLALLYSRLVKISFNFLRRLN